MDDQPSVLHNLDADIDQPSLQQAEAQAAALAEQRDTALLSLGVERLECRERTAEAAELRRQLVDLRAEVEISREQARVSSEEVSRLRQSVEQIRTSTAWRLMGPWRLLGRAVRDPGGTLRRIAGQGDASPDSAGPPVSPPVDERTAFLSLHGSMPIHFHTGSMSPSFQS